MEIFFFLGLFFLSFLPALDPDLGWQLRCGQLILQGQGFCGQNQFSALMSGYQWVNHYWLYQTMLFFIWEHFGFLGLSIFNALIVTLIFFVFDRTIKNYLWEKKIAILLLFYFSWGVFSLGIRGQLLGILYFTLVFFCLTKKKEIYLPLVFLFWANTHGSAVFGLATLLLFLFQDFKNISAKMLIFSACFFATFLNPFGWGIFPEAWRHLGGVHLDQLIAEWVPPSVNQRVLLFLSGLGLLFFSPRPLWPVIFSLFFLALRARRNVPFFWLLFFILFFQSRVVQKWLTGWQKKESLRKDLLLLTSFLLFFYGLVIQPRQTFQANASWGNYCQTSTVGYPCQAVEFLKKQPASSAGNLFNRYEWGGFLIWQLPQFKVFVDGRMPAWSTPSPYTIYLETLQTQPGWQETLDQHQIKWILISPGTFMDLKLQPDPEIFGWQEAYRDKISVIYRRIFVDYLE